MSNLLQLHQGDKSFALKALFEKAAFSLNAGEHVGVIGPNGAGKTTLFKILVGLEELDAGELTYAQGVRIGYLAQHDNWTATETVEEYLAKDLLLPIWELKSLARGLGLNLEHFDKPMSSLSGGYRMRVKLLHLLGQMPDLMLLDEPTNYLDLESVLVLENFLQDFKGAFLLISHDREFLRRTTEHTLEVEGGEITKYNGNIDDYFEQKAMIRDQILAREKNVQDKRKAILDFVSRFGAKATKAKQAQSRLKALGKLETIEIKALPVTAKIQLPPPVATSKYILRFENVKLGYETRTILSDVQLHLERGQHVAVVGVNGAGKSTLLKSLAGYLKPLEGEITRATEASVGYYAQHVAEALDAKSTVLESIASKAHPTILPQNVLNIAGALLFRDDDLHKKISVLSGGEKSRVALGQILLQKSPFLILDEPTNHLDFETVEALVEALNNYQGTVVIVSHDRAFIRRVGKQILEISNGKALFYPGNYDEYVWSQQKGVLSRLSDDAPESSTGTEIHKTTSNLKFNYKTEKKNFEKEFRQIQKQVSLSESRIEVLTLEVDELNQKIAHSSGQVLIQLVNEISLKQVELLENEEIWISGSEKLGELQEQMDSLLQKGDS